ncbi:MAG: alpha/beta hydrolase [Bacteroidales bacterium]|nr:alpha/beta hydrolase [Bacteroidales bacterium]
MARFFTKLFPLFLSAFLLQGCATSSLIIKLGLERKEKSNYMELSKKDMDRRTPGISHWIDSMYIAGAFKDTMIVRDGVNLHAVMAAADPGSRKTAVILHGYSANPIFMMHIARMFRDSLGYNVLLPSLRRHGESGGDAVQMGWNDRFDLLDWSAIAHERFGDTLQVYHGISMGAAAVMSASGEDTPDYVRGFVSDCGFSNLSDLIYKLAGDDYHLPAHLLMDFLEPKVNDRFGWSIQDVSPEEKLASCTKPMLFIHGDADQIVPTGMVWENYFAKTKGYCGVWIGKGSRHAFCFPDHPAEYTSVVRKFLKEQVE